MGFKELTIFPFLFRRLFSATASEPSNFRINSSKISSINWKKNYETLQNISPSNTTKLITRLVNMRVVKNMTKNGKIARFSSIVVAGNGNGGLGYGHAKHDSASEAVTKAGKLAVRNIQYFNRWQDRTLFHDDFAKYKATKLYVRPSPSNFGRRCHPTIAEMCRCLGIKDISAKVHGSSHPMNVMKAFLKILEQQKSPDQVAAETGMRVIDVLHVFETNCRDKPIRGDHTKQPNPNKS